MARDHGEVRLRHPLVRLAILQAASFADRQEAHLLLATALTHEPHRRAWHLTAAVTDDPQLLAEASSCRGWSLTVTLRHEEALGFLLPVAASMASPAPALALDALGTAATPTYQSGDPLHRAELQRAAALITGQPDRGDHPLSAGARGTPAPRPATGPRRRPPQ
ncbi:hypothetical protein [Streptomyces lydicus]|uniref:hypothetical protein n=1 Tax=Streptomyces lydicus TaxID=47763 RepID=UPI0034236B2C